MLRVVGFSRTETIWMLELPAPAVVVKLPGELMMKPDGCAVTVHRAVGEARGLGGEGRGAGGRAALHEEVADEGRRRGERDRVASRDGRRRLVIVAMAVDATVTVTVTGLGGVAPRLTENCCCRSRPTWMLVELKVIAGAVTVAITVRPLLGGLKPAGGCTATSEVPATAGSNGRLLERVAAVEDERAADDRTHAGASSLIRRRDRHVDREAAAHGLVRDEGESAGAEPNGRT